MAAKEIGSWSLPTVQVLEKLSANRSVQLAASLAALVLLTHGLARWTWRLLTPLTPASAFAPKASASDQAALDLQALLAANLFGQTQNAGGGTVNPKQLPLSSLNLVLTGVLAQGKAGFALISINSAPETPIMVGQELTAGAILEAVFPDRVVLRRGTVLETVLLKDSESTLPAGSITAPSSSAPRPDLASGAVRSLGGGMYSVDRQNLTQNLTAETLAQATVAASPGGLMVRDVQGGGIFEKIGLRTGDIVRTINGQPVTSLDDVAKVYAQFAATPQAGRVMVEVVRGGRSEVLQYQMQ